MKTITEMLNNRHRNTDFNYVMTFKQFKKWIKEQPKGNEYDTWSLIDTDMDIQDIVDNDAAYAKVYFATDEVVSSNNAKGEWIGLLGGEEDNDVPIDKWTLASDDIILISNI